MLVGTFQGIYPLAPSEVEKHRQELKAKEVDERNTWGKIITEAEWRRNRLDHQFLWLTDGNRPYTADLGYSPVWFFPMPTLADAFAQASLSVVHYPNYFYIYDLPEEELLKIDARRYANERFKYVQKLKFFDIRDIDYMMTFGAVGYDPKPPRLPLLFTTDTDDPAFINYIFDERKLDDYEPLFCYPVDQYSFNDRHALIGDYAPYDDTNIAFYYSSYIDDLDKYFTDGFVENMHPNYIKEIAMRMSPHYRILDYRGPAQISFHFDVYSFYYDKVLQCEKEKFTFADLPYLYKASVAKVENKPFVFKSKELLSIRRDFKAYTKLKSEFLRATSDGHMSKRTYKKIYNGLKDFVNSCQE